MIQKLLAISMFPLLLSSNQLKLTEEDVQNNRDYYEVIGATTGEKREDILYAEKRVIKTHITAVSAIKKALANEGIDLSTVRVLLYYDGLTVADSSLPRMWQVKPHRDTITSPWLDLTKTITNSGETKITIRIDATAARLLSDLFSQPDDKYKIAGFLSISSIKNSCYFEMLYHKYEKVFLEVTGIDKKWVANQFRKSYSCVPKELREPLLSLFQSSDHSGIGLAYGGFDFRVYNQLFLHCQDEAEKYYSELYPRLAVRGLQILESESNPKPQWWTEIIDRIEPIQECQR